MFVRHALVAQPNYRSEARATGRKKSTGDPARRIPDDDRPWATLWWMTTRRELIDSLGVACDNGNASIFVGAGLSRGAGLPDWNSLLEEPRTQLGLPTMPDLPLMAEYIETAAQYGPTRLETHLLDQLSLPLSHPIPPVHAFLARLPVEQIWTTNYDSLLERAFATRRPSLIIADNEIRNLGSSRTAVIKMHGSIDDLHARRWAESPVITRGDYERYEIDRPRTWALLRAAYMSRTFLFLGFSFTDPNVEILQRLARLNDTASHDQHLAIMRRPDDSEPDEQRLYDLRTADLKASGVRVHTIADYDEIETIVQALVRRTRPPRLFISGSVRKEEPEEVQSHFGECASAVGALLSARREWELVSLGGPAGWFVSREVARMRRAKRTYDASRIVFQFRRKDDSPPPLDERIGTSVFTDLEREPLVQGLLDESRVVLVVRGGDRTQEEARWAEEFGAGVVPLAVSGGYARQYWEEHRLDPPELGGQPTDRATWGRLGDSNVRVAADAAYELLAQAMYATPQAQ